MALEGWWVYSSEGDQMLLFRKVLGLWKHPIAADLDTRKGVKIELSKVLIVTFLSRLEVSFCIRSSMLGL